MLLYSAWAAYIAYRGADGLKQGECTAVRYAQGKGNTKVFLRHGERVA